MHRWGTLSALLVLAACKPEATATPIGDPDHEQRPEPQAFGLLHAIEGHEGHVWTTGYGARVLAVAVRDDGASHLWDVRAGTRLAPLSGPGRVPDGFAIDADAGLVLGAVEDGVLLWRVDAPGSPLEVAPSSRRLHGLGFAERGDAFLVWADDAALLVPKASPNEPRTLALPEVRWAQLSPRGDRILASTERGTALFDAADARAVFTDRPARAAVFDATGARVLAAGDRRCVLWDAATGKELAKVDAGKKCVRVEWSRDGSLAAMSTGGQTVVLDARTGKRRRSFPGHHGVAEGDRVAVAAGGAVVVYALDSGEKVAQVQSQGTPVALDPSGRVLVIDDVLSTSVWTIPDGNLVERFEQTRSPAATFSADGSEMLLHTERESSPAILLRLPSGERIGTVGEQRFAVEDLAVSPDGRLVAIAGGRGLRLVDAKSGAMRDCPEGDPDAAAAYVRVVFVGSDHVAAGTAMDVHETPPTVDLLDVNRCRIVRSIGGVASNVLDPILHGDGRGRAIVARRGGDDEDLAAVLELSGHGELRELATARTLGAIALHPDRDTLALGTAAGLVSSDGKTLANAAPVRTDALAFSPDGRRVAAAGIDGGVWLVDASRWTLDRTLATPGGEATAAVEVAFIGADRLVVGARGGALRIWDLDTGESIFELPAGEVATAFAVSPDARFVAIARGPSCDPDDEDPRCGPGRVRPIEIRDARSLRPVIALEDHFGAVVELVFSPTGNVLASGGADHRVAIWSLPQTEM